jgi:hypothetical protein
MKEEKNGIKKTNQKGQKSSWKHQQGITYFKRIYLDIRFFIRSVLHGILKGEFRETDNPTYT